MTTATRAGPSSPTPTALAAKAFMERIDNRSFMQTIESRALNGGWAGSRAAGAWDPHISDSISRAAIRAVIDLFRAWAAECDEPAADPTSEETTGKPAV